MSNETQLLSDRLNDSINKEQLASIQTRLSAMKKQLLTTVTNSAETGRSSDPVDQAQQDSQQLVELRKMSLNSNLLSDVEKALYRIEIGEYGYCEISGEPIDVQRLLANPTSRTSIEEQERLELNQTIRQRQVD